MSETRKPHVKVPRTTSTFISPRLPSLIRGLYRADLREKSIQNMLDLAADLVQELIDMKADAAVGAVPPLHPDEREPIAVNPVLRGVDLALDRLIRRDCFTERTLRVIDELREELALMRVGGQL